MVSSSINLQPSHLDIGIRSFSYPVLSRITFSFRGVLWKDHKLGVVNLLRHELRHDVCASVRSKAKQT
eukprot:scaffold218448_cov16-Prasinocladus_malaysianus.AAC.1